jgi:hypothetical protein
MSIQKKSLISTLKSAKKANVASASTQEADAKGTKVASMRQATSKKVFKGMNLKSAKMTSSKLMSAKTLQ